MPPPTTPLACLKALMSAVDPQERTHESGVLVKDFSGDAADKAKLYDTHGASHKTQVTMLTKCICHFEIYIMQLGFYPRIFLLLDMDHTH